jgi:type IV secretory pathway protease TraF
VQDGLCALQGVLGASVGAPETVGAVGAVGAPAVGSVGSVGSVGGGGGVCDTAKSVVTPGEVIFFSQPEALRRYISRYDLPPIRGGDLLVKRVYVGGVGVGVGVGGVGVGGVGGGGSRGSSGSSLTTTATTAPTTIATTTTTAPLCIEVRGDNPQASLDSRQFGCIPDSLVVGRPLGIVWPPSRIGPLRPLTGLSR